MKSKEIDFMTERNLLSLFDGTPTRGVYMAEDPTEISVQGIWESLSKRYINVTFTVCDASFGVECLP